MLPGSTEVAKDTAYTVHVSVLVRNSAVMVEINKEIGRYEVVTEAKKNRLFLLEWQSAQGTSRLVCFRTPNGEKLVGSAGKGSNCNESVALKDQPRCVAHTSTPCPFLTYSASNPAHHPFQNGKDTFPVHLSKMGSFGASGDMTSLPVWRQSWSADRRDAMQYIASQIPRPDVFPRRQDRELLERRR